MSATLQVIGYYLAALLVATLPAAVLYWLLIHPWARFWRRVGKGVAFTLVAIICLSLAVLLFAARDTLLAVHWGYHWPLIAAGLLLYGLAAFGERAIRKHLTFRTLVGAPELDSEQPGELLTEGPFARCRNPRYVNIVVAMLGWAMILNYAVLYATVLISVPLLYLVVLLEERELRQRFGAAYVEYCRRVPRFLPRGGWIF